MEKLPVIVTGASGSMGAAAVEAVAASGSPVIMACRNLSKGSSVRDSVLAKVPGAMLELRELDLSSIASVRSFASSLQGVQLAALFNNAGTLNRDFSLTKDGYEADFQVNCIGPSLLALLLKDNLAPDAHIVNMVSLTCRFARFGADYFGDSEPEFSQLGTYSRSKLALLLFTLAFARRHEDVHVNVSDPGVVNSNMISMGRWFDPLADIFFRPFFCSPPEKGVRPAVSALSTQENLKYFVGKGFKEMPGRYLGHPASEPLYERITSMIK
jgi:Dehydrogenases with different specificities (related to short-chain alcohol dehydrogenases)